MPRAAPFSYRTMRGDQQEHPLWWAVTHFFNHQTHHRGQVTTLLSQAGIDPGVTDLIPLMRASRTSVDWGGGLVQVTVTGKQGVLPIVRSSLVPWPLAPTRTRRISRPRIRTSYVACARTFNAENPSRDR